MNQFTPVAQPDFSTVCFFFDTCAVRNVNGVLPVREKEAQNASILNLKWLPASILPHFFLLIYIIRIYMCSRLFRHHFTIQVQIVFEKLSENWNISTGVILKFFTILNFSPRKSKNMHLANQLTFPCKPLIKIYNVISREVSVVMLRKKFSIPTLVNL